jgi:AcrR family transcriptional regulator
MQQAKVIVDAAIRLIVANGAGFTTQELVKEAGVALQTFYRYFAGKDQLLLAVLEEMIGESCVEYEAQARGLTDPVDRLRFYVTAILTFPDAPAEARSTRQFITAEHWRLQGLYPGEIAEATRPVTELLLGEIRAGVEAGLLEPVDPEHDAWVITQLVMAVFHHYAFAPAEEAGEAIGQRVWTFCLSALGGAPYRDKSIHSSPEG